MPRLARSTAPTRGRSPAATPLPSIPVYSYEVIHAYPHDLNAFTEGLFYQDGFLYESTGLVGRSSVRKVELKTGEVLSQANLPPDVFGEGIASWNGQLVGLTWQSHVGFVLDLRDFSLAGASRMQARAGD